MKLLHILSRACIAAALSLVSLSCADAEVRAARELAGRVMGDRAGQVRFETIAAPGGCEYYEVEGEAGDVVVRGTNAQAMAVGLNRYLKNACRTSVSWFAHDAVVLPERLPAVPGKLSAEARCDKRFFLNYCTFGYTMPWWGWAEWERLIDWMALNGVNMPLAITGQEAVWQRVWGSMGLTDEQIRNYFTGPAHLPWHRMSNLDRWEGPLPQGWLDGQEALQKQILGRERALGMTPVLPAFAGHVPAELQTLHPEADIMTMSSWGGFKDAYRSSFLSPTDPLFAQIQQKFLAEQTRLYGTDHIYGADPLNEVQLPRWDAEYLASVARHIYASLEAADPEAVWLQMTWHFFYDKEWTDELREAFMRAVPGDKLVSLDYYCENAEVSRITEGYYGKPFLWCYLGNFGGNTMLKGNLRETGRRLKATLAERENCCGIGSTLEALDVNPLMYEYLFDKAWTASTDDDLWIGAYADSHAGCEDADFRAAWQWMLDSVYVDCARLGQGTLTNSRPSLYGQIRWTQPANSYDNAGLCRAWGRMLDAQGAGPMYDFDLVNVGRQVLGNHFAVLRDGFTRACEKRDAGAMQRQKEAMMTLFDDMDRLLACHPTFSLARWIEAARSWGTNDAERDYYERNARNILTTWGDRDQSLNDYANRGWTGLVSTYYKPRWELFCNEAIGAVAAGRTFDEAAFTARCKDFEWEWVCSTDKSGLDDVCPAAKPVAEELYARYRTQIE